MSMRKKTALFLALLFFVILGFGLADALRAKPTAADGGGPSALFDPAPAQNLPSSSPSPSLDKPSSGPSPSQNLPSSSLNEPSSAPTRLAYFADLSDPFSARFGELLKEMAEETRRISEEISEAEAAGTAETKTAETETEEEAARNEEAAGYCWDLVIYNTKGREKTLATQVASATASEQENAVAILSDPRGDVAASARSLKEAGYRVITLNCTADATGNRDIRAILEQDWEETASLLQGNLAADLGETGYILLSDRANASLEEALEGLPFPRLAIGYAAGVQENGYLYSRGAIANRENLGCILTTSAAVSRGVLQAAEEAKTLPSQGVDGEENAVTSGEGEGKPAKKAVKVASLTIDDEVRELLREQRLDLAIGITPESAYEVLRDALPDVLNGKYVGKAEIAPILLTQDTENP